MHLVGLFQSTTPKILPHFIHPTMPESEKSDKPVEISLENTGIASISSHTTTCGRSLAGKKTHGGPCRCSQQTLSCLPILPYHIHTLSPLIHFIAHTSHTISHRSTPPSSRQESVCPFQQASIEHIHATTPTILLETREPSHHVVVHTHHAGPTLSLP